MRWMIAQGNMYLRREEHLIFHGCVPVDEQGDFLSMTIDGKPYTGRALFQAIERVVYRVIETRKRDAREQFDRRQTSPAGNKKSLLPPDPRGLVL